MVEDIKTERQKDIPEFVVLQDIEHAVSGAVKDPEGRVPVAAGGAAEPVIDYGLRHIHNFITREPVPPAEIDILKVHEIEGIKSAEGEKLTPSHHHQGCADRAPRPRNIIFLRIVVHESDVISTTVEHDVRTGRVHLPRLVIEHQFAPRCANCGLRGHRLKQRHQPAPGHNGIIVEEDEKFPGGSLGAPVISLCKTVISVECHHLHRGEFSPQILTTPISGSIVNDDDLRLRCLG